MAYSLTAYAAIAMLGSLVLLASRLGSLSFFTPDFQARLGLYFAMLLAVFFYALSRSFLRLDDATWRAWTAGVAAIGLLLFLDANVLLLPNTLLQGYGWILPRTNVVVFGLVCGWAVFIGYTAWLTYRVYQRTEQPLHRNRLSYWLPALSLIVVGDGLMLAQQTLLGVGLHLAGAAVAGYATLVHRLPDVRSLLRRGLNYLLVTLASAMVYLLVFLLAEGLLRVATGYNSLLAGAALIVIALAVALNLTLAGVRRLVQRFVSTTIRYDSRQMLGEYGSNISNIVDLEHLAEVALGLIRDAMHVRRGVLFRVDMQVADSGGDQYYLRGIKSLTDETPPSGLFKGNSPVVHYLRTEYSPLTQYDIDLLPQFRETALEEFLWLANLALDVYVPIYAKDKWIGLLALGPKASRDRYYDDDLAFLSTLADQTAVAFENARLFDDLVRLNADLRQAYVALDEANQELSQLDKAKSNFINIVSHELRTPLTIMLGYSEILNIDSTIQQNPMHKQMVAGVYSGATRLREIIESMVDVAKIDSRTLILNPQPIPLSPLIQGVCDTLQPAATQRKLDLVMEDLKTLPPIEADLEALRKVFWHIIVNAVKYTPDGGRIRIVGRAASATEIQITVQDSGIGIDPRFLDVIFTKFYQTGEVATHSSGQTKFKGGGPGLGLAIAKGIVEAHGGRVWAESVGHDETTNPGSQFHVMLPIRHKQTAIEKARQTKPVMPITA